MEIIGLLAIPVLTSILAPIVLEIVRKRIADKKAEQAEVRDQDAKNDEMAAALRTELRTDNTELRERNATLEAQHLADLATIHEAEKWKKDFYALRKEKRALEFEVVMLKQELEYLRSTYEEYTKIRKRLGYDGDSDDT